MCWAVSYTHLDVYKRQKQHRIEVEKANASEAAKKIDEKTIKMTAKAGQGGRLFGSVTAKEITEELKKQYGCLLYTSRCV